MTKKNYFKSENQVTLLLTIFNRRTFTLRWIKFIQEFNCPFKIYICDGGNDIFLQKKLTDVAKKNKNITYKKFKYYKNYQKFFEKFYLATKEIKTEFTYLCDDDDFLIFENIKKSENFLKRNKDYTSSGGQSYNMEILSDDFFISRTEHKSKNISFKNNSRFKRVINLLRNMQSNWNCLHRTNNLLKTFGLINKIEYKSFQETELLFILSSFYFGKIKRFNHIEYIKIDNTKFSSSENFSKKTNYIDIISSKNYSFENYAFLFYFKKYLTSKQNLLLEKTLNTFLAKENIERIEKIYPSTKIKLINCLIFYIKTILKKTNTFNLTKKIYIKFTLSKNQFINIYYKSEYVRQITNKNLDFFKKLMIFNAPLTTGKQSKELKAFTRSLWRLK